MLFPYEAENADELTLEEGQIITIIDKVRLRGYAVLNECIDLQVLSDCMCSPSSERVHVFAGF